MFGMWLRARPPNINQASGAAWRAAAAAERRGRALQLHPLGVYRRCSSLNGRSSVASIDCRPAHSRAAEKGPTLVPLATSPAAPQKHEDSTPVSKTFIFYLNYHISAPFKCIVFQ